MALLVKNLPANVGDVGSIPGSARSPGEGNGNPLHYSCLGNPMDRGAWRAAVHRVQRSDRTERTHTGTQAQSRNLHRHTVVPDLSHAHR